MKKINFKFRLTQFYIIWVCFCLFWVYIFLTGGNPLEKKGLEKVGLENESNHLLYRCSSIAFGDGIRMSVFEFEDDVEKSILENKKIKWEELPYKKRILNNLFEYNKKPKITFEVKDNKKHYLPWIEKGYYILFNEVNDNNKFMRDYQLYVYDKEKYILYYIESHR